MLDLWNSHVQLKLLTVLNILEGLIVIATREMYVCDNANSKFWCIPTVRGSRLKSQFSTSSIQYRNVSKTFLNFKI
jgi:hypothetical protein